MDFKMIWLYIVDFFKKKPYLLLIFPLVIAYWIVKEYSTGAIALAGRKDSEQTMEEVGQIDDAIAYAKGKADSEMDQVKADEKKIKRVPHLNDEDSVIFHNSRRKK